MEQLSACDLLSYWRLNIHFASAGCSKRPLHNLADIDGSNGRVSNSANGAPKGPRGLPGLPRQRDVGHVNLAFDHTEG
ncbi:unnamed protein product [Acanthoscelides obtectus]|uniref:Uncharacterized protein n=1 Tax=Acanthoscelides obtectus TaxID=200917 RepID=A0A9P0Q8G5_ACAOB|nr:unnamed protein product [Acanthoscelides obtectus]CAK1645602.1 hypothetical protein AOBTE_LOCUS14164 [Acanthoscelides obtectus]